MNNEIKFYADGMQQHVAVAPKEFWPDQQPKALRYNAGKFLMSLVPPSLVRYTAAVLTYGAIKYAPNNWRKGFKWTSILDSLERHLVAWKEGEDLDEESGLPHLAHIACNLAFLIEHFDARMGIDDRTKMGRRAPLVFNDPKKERQI